MKISPYQSMSAFKWDGQMVKNTNQHLKWNLQKKFNPADQLGWSINKIRTFKQNRKSEGTHGFTLKRIYTFDFFINLNLKNHFYPCLTLQTCRVASPPT